MVKLYRDIQGRTQSEWYANYKQWKRENRTDREGVEEFGKLPQPKTKIQTKVKVVYVKRKKKKHYRPTQAQTTRRGLESYLFGI